MADAPPESIDAEFVPVRGERVYTVAIDGEAVLLDEDANRLHHLNATAALLWSCFDGHARVGDLAAEIADELDVQFDTVLVDSLVVVRHLGAEGLLAGIEGTYDDDEPAP